MHAPSANVSYDRDSSRSLSCICLACAIAVVDVALFRWCCCEDRLGAVVVLDDANDAFSDVDARANIYAINLCVGWVGLLIGGRR